MVDNINIVIIYYYYLFLKFPIHSLHTDLSFHLIPIALGNPCVYIFGDFLGHPLEWLITRVNTVFTRAILRVTPPSRHSVYHCVANSTLLTTHSTSLLLKLKKSAIFFHRWIFGTPSNMTHDTVFTLFTRAITLCYTFFPT